MDTFTDRKSVDEQSTWLKAEQLVGAINKRLAQFVRSIQMPDSELVVLAVLNVTSQPCHTARQRVQVGTRTSNTVLWCSVQRRRIETGVVYQS